MVWRIENTSGIGDLPLLADLGAHRQAAPGEPAGARHLAGDALDQQLVGVAAARGCCASVSASTAMPASVTRSVSWPNGPRSRTSRPAASSSISTASWHGQPAER